MRVERDGYVVRVLFSNRDVVRLAEEYPLSALAEHRAGLTVLVDGRTHEVLSVTGCDTWETDCPSFSRLLQIASEESYIDPAFCMVQS